MPWAQKSDRLNSGIGRAGPGPPALRPCIGPGLPPTARASFRFPALPSFRLPDPRDVIIADEGWGDGRGVGSRQVEYKAKGTGRAVPPPTIELRVAAPRSQSHHLEFDERSFLQVVDGVPKEICLDTMGRLSQSSPLGISFCGSR